MNALHRSPSLFEPAATTSRTRNPGFRRAFGPGRLTLGLMFPIEAFVGDQPSMAGQADMAQRAEAAGFAALWIRDVPLRIPSFGDTGQVFDPWVWLGHLTARTEAIALVTGSIVLPLRHAVHVAKAAASVDRLSGGRLVLGVASGDRPGEFPAFGVDFDTRGEVFRERFQAIREISTFSRAPTVEVVPRPFSEGIPMLVTGNSRQSLDWIARHADGWVTYPRETPLQSRIITAWQDAVRGERPGEFLPFAQSLYIDLDSDPAAGAQPIHLGYRLGRAALIAHLEALQAAGANHVALNLKYGSRPAAAVVDEIARWVLPRFPTPVP